VAVPGAVILNYSINSNWVKVILAVAVLVSVFLTISSIVELSYSLNNKLQYYYESASHHSTLTREFESLAKSDVFTEIELNKYNRLIGEQTVRDTQDERYNISAKEERKGMRYGLRHFQRECVGCCEVPLSLESTNCEICGKY
jgi:mobilome CxxCx(11)CxxC protein